MHHTEKHVAQGKCLVSISYTVTYGAVLEWPYMPLISVKPHHIQTCGAHNFLYFTEEKRRTKELK